MHVGRCNPRVAVFAMNTRQRHIEFFNKEPYVLVFMCAITSTVVLIMVQIRYIKYVLFNYEREIIITYINENSTKHHQHIYVIQYKSYSQHNFAILWTVITKLVSRVALLLPHSIF